MNESFQANIDSLGESLRKRTCHVASQLCTHYLRKTLREQMILGYALSDDAVLFKNFIATDQIPQRSDLKIVLPSESVKQRLYKEQEGKCNVCGKDFDLLNLELDHIIPKAKGGGDYYENYQLLCSSCNRIKGDRPMEYLRLKIETRERMMKTQIFFGE